MIKNLFKITCALFVLFIGCSNQEEQLDANTSLKLDVSELRKGISSEANLVVGVEIFDISDLDLYENGATDEKGNRLGISGASGFSGPITSDEFSLDMESMPISTDVEHVIEFKIANMPADFGVGNETINEYLIYFGSATLNIADGEVKNLNILLKSQSSSYEDVTANLTIMGYNAVAFCDENGDCFSESQYFGN